MWQNTIVELHTNLITLHFKYSNNNIRKKCYSVFAVPIERLTTRQPPLRKQWSDPGKKKKVSIIVFFMRTHWARQWSMNIHARHNKQRKRLCSWNQIPCSCLRKEWHLWRGVWIPACCDGLPPVVVKDAVEGRKKKKRLASSKQYGWNAVYLFSKHQLKPWAGVVTAGQ